MNALTAATLRALAQTITVHDSPQGLWRVPLCHANTPSLESITRSMRGDVPSCCLHLNPESSVAGCMCRDCGLVMTLVNQPAEERGPVSVKVSAPPESNVADPCEQARMEWNQHTTSITGQPEEVMQHAWFIFQSGPVCNAPCIQQVFQSQGSVSGVKAKALVLVSLLYSSRLLHGSNRSNEEYLLRCLQTPTRIMNKAFTQMATVTLPDRVCREL